MNRRQFMRNSSCAAIALAAPAALGSDKPMTAVRVRGGPPLTRISRDFLGLGYEISSVATPGLLSRTDPVYVQLARTLGLDGVVRVGGNTADYARYNPAGQAIASPFGTVVNDAALQELGGFLKATGWKLIWALNLGRGSEADAVAEAKAVLTAAGERLLAFEIGNEPDLFSHAKHRPTGYSYEQWLADYRRYKTTLRAQIPGVPLAGPDVAGKTDWVTRFAADEGKDAVLLTHHYYREGQNPGSTIEKLLGVDPKLQSQLDQLRAASQSCGVPYRICEVNSFSGGGRPGVSNTLAAALWVLDYMFILAANGCSGVNMETGVNQLGFISSYSPIGDDERGHHSAAPEYYGMLAFALAGRGDLLPVDIDAPNPEIKAYATRPKEGDLMITVINKGDVPSGVRLDTASQRKEASVVRLTGPAMDAKMGIMLGGAEVASSGAWIAVATEVLPLRKGQAVLSMPAASGAIVSILQNNS
jgi:hypothetical protein